MFECLQKMVWRSQSPTNQSESFYQQDNPEPPGTSYYGSNPDLIPIKNCKSCPMFPGGKSSQLFADSDSGEGLQHQQQFCSQLDSALLLGNQRVAVKTLPLAGPAACKRQQSPSQVVSSPVVPPFPGSSTPSRYCDNVSLGKSSKEQIDPMVIGKLYLSF